MSRPQFLVIVVSLVAASTTLRLAHGLCNSTDAACQPGAGSCSAALQIALAGGTREEAGSALIYGKLCGFSNNCFALTNPMANDPAQCRQGDDNCPPTACDDIDATCGAQGACYANYDDVTLPAAYCNCDALFVANLAAVASTGPSTGRCDAAFYTDPVDRSRFGNQTGINLFVHEAVLLAAPYCCGLTATGGSGTTNVSICQTAANDAGFVDVFASANAFCGVILQAFTDGGLDLCSLDAASGTTPTSAPTTLPTTTPSSGPVTTTTTTAPSLAPAAETAPGASSPTTTTTATSASRARGFAWLTTAAAMAVLWTTTTTSG